MEANSGTDITMEANLGTDTRTGVSWVTGTLMAESSDMDITMEVN
jgi:hypothetical protein